MICFIFNKSKSYITFIFLLFIFHFHCGLSDNSLSSKLKCNFPSHTSDYSAMVTILNKLSGKRYVASDEQDNYEYRFGICDSAEILPEGKYQKAGIVQIDKSKNSQSSGKKFIIGQYTNAEIKDGNNWALLEYNDGDKYNSHCDNGARSASIMMLCNENEKNGLFRVLEENVNRTKGNCYYLFEFEHSAICHMKTDVARPYYFSAGDILCMIFFLVVTVYLVLGVLFNAIIRQKRGIEMLPNISLWQNLGNLIADGCDLVFRSGMVGLPQSYRDYPYRPALNSSDNQQSETAGVIAEESDSDGDEYLLRP